MQIQSRLTRPQLDHLVTLPSSEIQSLYVQGQLTDSHLSQIQDHVDRLIAQQPSTPEEFDDLKRKEFNRFLRARPAMDIPSLSFLLPSGVDKLTTINKAKTYRFVTPWDEVTPESFRPLEGTLVFEYTLPAEKPSFNRFFQKTGTVKVPTPQGSALIVTPINLRLPYGAELTEGFDYISISADGTPGWVFAVPRTFLEEYLPYTLVVSRSKLKSIESWKLTLNTNMTFYLSVVQALPDASRFQGTSVVPLISQYSSDFSRYIPYLFLFWVSQGFIPEPSQFTLSTGEILSIVHTRSEDTPS